MERHAHARSGLGFELRERDSHAHVHGGAMTRSRLTARRMHGRRAHRRARRSSPRRSARSSARTRRRPSPTSLDAVVVSATRTEQALKSLPMHVVVLDATKLTASAATDGARPAARRARLHDARFPVGARRRSEPIDRVLPRTRWLVRRSRARAARRHSRPAIHSPDGSTGDASRCCCCSPPRSCAAAARPSGAVVRSAGVVNLRTIDPHRDGAQLMLEGGSRGTYHGTGMASAAPRCRRPSRSAATSGTPTAS